MEFIYPIIKPKYSIFIRILTVVLINFVAVASILLVGVFLQANQAFILLTLGGLILLEFVLAYEILSYKTIGKIDFHEDKLVLEYDEFSNTIYYKNITKMQYKKGLTQSLVFTPANFCKAYFIKIFTTRNAPIFIHVGKNPLKNNNNRSLIPTIQSIKTLQNKTSKKLFLSQK